VIGLIARGAAAILIWLLLSPAAVGAQPYTGPLIDAHSHLPGLDALDSLIPAMDRHQISQVALLGVGGAQPRDLEWIEAAAKKYPERVIPFAPLPRPTDPASVKTLGRLLATGRFRGVGEVHVRQVSRKIAIPADHSTSGPRASSSGTPWIACSCTTGGSSGS